MFSLNDSAFKDSFYKLLVRLKALTFHSSLKGAFEKQFSSRLVEF